MAPEDISGHIGIEVLMTGGGGAEGVAGEPGAAGGGGVAATGDIKKARKASMKGAEAQIKSAAVMKKFLPAMAGAAGIIGIAKGTTILTTTLKAIGDIISMLFDLLLMPLIPLLIPLIQILVPLVHLITQFITPMIGPMGKVLGMIIELLMPFIEFAAEAMEAIMGPITKIGDIVVGWVRPFIEFATSWWRDVLGGWLDWIKTKMNDVWNILSNTYNWIIDLPGLIFDKIKDAFGGIGDALGGLKFWAKGTPYVPKTQLAVVHQGERIIPASQNRPGMMGGGGGTQVFIEAPMNIEAHSNMDIEDLGNLIGDTLAEKLTTQIRRKLGNA